MLQRTKGIRKLEFEANNSRRNSAPVHLSRSMDPNPRGNQQLQAKSFALKPQI